ncbi:SEC-C metal-binding domain-containing protein [Clostridium tyrobutyricum]|uniref:SEC-C metal-binding domain-containing protein n=1 Tax=Clostridium tyrobutyricum TaxID=1519 RepID=UPI001C38A636|nr:SEC-C metal-binding domain-containing protein [Clostridium tyrobutyricum]MBV4423756.1 SEC-C domain-containing protein [Clostridium tyrobutyricum]
MKGKCYYCNNEFTKSGMSRHLKNCNRLDKSSVNSAGKFILFIEARYNPDYWLYINIDKEAKLKDLDRFLRNIWVECCGHLSRFSIHGENYDSEIDTDEIWNRSKNNMNVIIKNIIKLKDDIDYEYDLGNTTYLKIKVIDEIKWLKTKNKIEIMARNNKPDILCAECDRKAEYYDYENQEYLCVKCSKKAFRNVEMIEKLEYENSPRDRVCSYHGNKYNEVPYLPEVLEDDACLWDKIDENFDLTYHLERLTKKQLLDICKNLYIKKVSGLKKDDLKNIIKSVYKDRMNVFIDNIDIARFHYILNYLNNSEYRNDNSHIDKIMYFKNRAVLFNGIINGKRSIIVPQELEEIIRNKNNLQNRLKKNEELIKLFCGMCFYYGVLNINDFRILAKSYVNYNLSDFNLDIIMENASEYYGIFKFRNGIGCNIYVKDISYILNKRNEKRNLNFYPFKKQQLLSSSKPGFIDRTKFYRRLSNYLINNLNLSKSSVESLMYNLEISIKNGEDFDEMVLNLIGDFKFEKVEQAAHITNEICYFSNNTRQWITKGYTIEELNHNTVQNKIKIGRNDLCPCGSGKKYKNCCGRK